MDNLTLITPDILAEEIIVDRSPELRRSVGREITRGSSMRVANVTVTEEDIKEGRRGNGSSCAIARAFTRKGYKNVSLEGEQPTIDGAPVSMDENMVDWIHLFDTGANVAPMVITFEVYAPCAE